jgi:hypothetical protein
VFFLVLVPYPYCNWSESIPYYFEMTTNNWVDNSGAYPAHGHEYTTLYYVSDIMLVAMFLRIYFLVQSFVLLSPTMSLQGKRLCIERNFEPTLKFHIRACLIKYPT